MDIISILTALLTLTAGIGAFMMLFSKSDAWKKTGGILTGFGMLFVGLSMMANAMDEFAALDSVKLFLASIRNPLLLVLLGAIITGPELRTCCRPPHQCGENHSRFTINNSLTL